MNLNENLEKVLARFDELSNLMADPEAVASGDFKTLTSKAAAFIKAVADARA